MNNFHEHHGAVTGPRKTNRTLAWFCLSLVALAAGAYFGAGHWAHVGPYLPFVILLLCPLMHLFGGHGHGSHGSKGGDRS